MPRLLFVLLAFSPFCIHLFANIRQHKSVFWGTFPLFFLFFIKRKLFFDCILVFLILFFCSSSLEFLFGLTDSFCKKSWSLYYEVPPHSHSFIFKRAYKLIFCTHLCWSVFLMRLYPSPSHINLMPFRHLFRSCLPIFLLPPFSRRHFLFSFTIPQCITLFIWQDHFILPAAYHLFALRNSTRFRFQAYCFHHNSSYTIWS